MSADCFQKIKIFQYFFSGIIIPSVCQTVWYQIKPDMSGLIWVQTVCKGYLQRTKDVTKSVVTGRERVELIQKINKLSSKLIVPLVVQSKLACSKRCKYSQNSNSKLHIKETV